MQPRPHVRVHGPPSCPVNPALHWQSVLALLAMEMVVLPLTHGRHALLLTASAYVPTLHAMNRETACEHQTLEPAWTGRPPSAIALSPLERCAHSLTYRRMGHREVQHSRVCTGSR